jgi:IS30 family transposase
MKRRFLEDCLAAGMSLGAIGELAGRHPSTVSYG